MGFVEAVLERAAAMAGRAKGHALRGDLRIRLLRIISGHQPRYVGEFGWRHGLSGQRIDFLTHETLSVLSKNDLHAMLSAIVHQRDQGPIIAGPALSVEFHGD